MRFVYLMIVMAFPVLDLIATMRIARWSGIPVWIWLVLPLLAGFLLLRNERLEFRARTLGALRGDGPLLRNLFDSGRKILAGFLLILPGIISDLAAVALLALPLNLSAAQCGPRATPTSRRSSEGSRRAPIDGEYRRLP